MSIIREFWRFSFCEGTCDILKWYEALGERGNNMQPTYNDCVFLHKRQVVTDARFDLDGNKLITIMHGENILEADRDYMVSEGYLILKASFLLSLPSHSLGEVAMLRCNFADGPVREIRVFQLDVQEAKGTKVEEPARRSNMQRKAVGFAIGGAGVLAAAAVVKVVMSRRKK